MSGTLLRVGGWMGINNVDDPSALQPDERGVLQLVEANDVNIDNGLALASRDGTILKATLTKTHSLWSNNTVCFVMDNGSLKRMLADYSTVTLKTGLDANAKMSYADSKSGRIYMSNGIWIGYYQDGTVSDLVEPTDTYKKKMPAGRYLCYHKGHLYVAIEKFVYVSDGLKYNQYDVRTGFFVMNGPVIMMAPVDDGIYIADGSVYFVSGATHHSFLRKEICSCNAIPNSQAEVSLSLVGDGTPGTGVLFWTEEGAYLGTSGGNATNMTNDRYRPMSGFWSSAVVRQQDNYYQYITTIQS